MKKHLKASLIMIFVIVIGITGYLVGNKSSDEIIDSQTFYAIIENINDNLIVVEGLKVNDINYRTKYSFRVKDTTVLEWRGTKIQLSDLNVGDRISITFNGEILDSYPGQLTNVIRIQLLEDEGAQTHKEFTVIDETEICADALELIHEDRDYKYYFPCIKSATVFIKFADNRKMPIKEALRGDHIGYYLDFYRILEQYPNLFYKEEKGHSPSVTAKVKEGTAKNTGATLLLTNHTNHEFMYGEPYYIERREKDKWIRIKPTIKTPYGFNSIGYILKANQTVERKYGWEWLYGKLPAGQYRINIEFNDLRSVSAEFTIQ